MFELFPRWWKFGRPADFWVTHVAVVEEAIDRYGLEPVPRENLMQLGGFEPVDVEMGEIERFPVKLRPPDFPGGLKVPHLHFCGQLYLLDDKQWHDFSANVVERFQSKLSRAHMVSFEQMMELSDVVHGIGSRG